MGGLIRALARAAFLASIVVASPTNSHPAPGTDIASGDYGGELMVGVDPVSHVVSGYFQSSTGNGMFNCTFYFSGKTGGADIPIRSYYPTTPNEVIPGRLVKKAGGGFQIRLVGEHGGCGNVQHFADKDQPAEYTLATAHPWISVTVVKSIKAYFFNSPLSKAPRKAYVVRGDGVGVRAVRPGWLQVDYIGSDKPVTGWIRSSDVYTLR